MERCGLTHAYRLHVPSSRIDSLPETSGYHIPIRRFFGTPTFPSIEFHRHAQHHLPKACCPLPPSGPLRPIHRSYIARNSH